MKEDKKESINEITQILDFANMVFSMSSGSVDFERLLPKAYSQERSNLLTHHLMKEAGQIKAFIDVFPMNLRMDKESLKAGYIGTVSVHPKSRGKNYMITLMEEVEETQRQEKTDLLILDGNRKRYQYFGFEKAGIKYCFNLTSDSVRHTCLSITNNENRNKEKDYQFVLLEREEETLIEKAYSLYKQRNVITRESEEFYLYLESWEADTYIVLEDEICIGYLNVSADERNILEFELEEMKELPFVLQAFMEEIGSDELGINVGMDEIEKIEQLESTCDYYTLNTSHQIKILNYEKVLAFLLQWKSRITCLEEGTFIIGVCRVNGEKKNYEMQHQNGRVSVRETRKQAQIALEEKELIKVLTTSYYYHAMQKENNPLWQAPKGWFPLPFFLPEADAF